MVNLKLKCVKKKEKKVFISFLSILNGFHPKIKKKIIIIIITKKKWLYFGIFPSCIYGWRFGSRCLSL
jgi:hypothetical protein